MFIKELVLQTQADWENPHDCSQSLTELPLCAQAHFYSTSETLVYYIFANKCSKNAGCIIFTCWKVPGCTCIIIIQVKAQIIQFWEYFGHFTSVNKITISSGQSNCCSRLMDKTWDTTDSKNFKFQKFMEGFAGIPRPLKYIRI